MECGVHGPHILQRKSINRSLSTRFLSSANVKLGLQLVRKEKLSHLLATLLLRDLFFSIIGVVLTNYYNTLINHDVHIYFFQSSMYVLIIYI